jgi:PAS domain S-box-containing protein
MKRRHRGASGPADAGTDAARGQRAWPLRRYLIGLVALFVAAAATATWSAWTQAEHNWLSAARNDAAHGAQMAAKQIGENLGLVRSAVDQVGGSPTIRQVFTAPQGCQLAFASPGGHLDVVRTDGTVACSSKPPAGTGPNGYAAASWLPAALIAPQLVAPTVDGRTGRQAVVISTPVRGLGAVVAFLDLAAIGNTAGELFGGSRQLEFLVRTADATILTRWPDGEQWAGTSTRDSGFAPPTGAGEGRDVTGLRRVYGQASVDGVGWPVYAGAPRGAALAAAHRLARRQALIAGVGLLAGLLATLLVYRRITRPISQLRGAVRAAAASGGVDSTVTVRGPREVAELGTEFTNLLAAVDRELDERRHAEATAREHERNYRQMFDTSPYPIYLFDPDSLAIVEANDAAVNYYGHARAALLTMTVTALGPPEDAEALAAGIAAAGPVDHARGQRQVKHDGTVAEVSVTSHVLSFAGREVRCAVLEDVTEREHLERRLRLSQRMESLGELAGGIAHDFNNLLGIILGYAAMSARDVEAAAQDDPAWRALHDDLVQIVAAGDRAAALTRQLLAFAAAGAVAEPRVLDLNSVVADIDKLLSRTLGADIRLVTQLTDQPWPVKADPSQLEQVLMNLAVNARDAMPDGGTLTIETDQVTVDEHYAAGHPGLRAGRYMRLRVSDTGAGMSKAVIERAFEPFFTTKPKGHGTGLGLATIYGIIKHGGGHAQIYSEPGLGTTITALLPATDEAVDTAQPASSQTADRGDGHVVLLVEDDDSLRALTERILSRHGYTVLSAGAGAEAQQIATASPRIDLLLTDVVMPGMDGHALATALEAIHPALKVIYMSGYTETILAARNTLPAGVTLLNKPVTVHQVLSAVARSIDSERRSATRTRRRPS